MKNKVSSFKDPDGKKGYHFHCEGCNSTHLVYVEGKGVPIWTFNGDKKTPTFSPSVLVKWVSLPDNIERDQNSDYVEQADGRIKGAKDEVCHSFVRDGKIQYLNDCTHHLKGKTVDLLEF